MIIKANDSHIRYTGRWNVKGELATSSANGNYFEFGFVGECAQIAFKTENLVAPFPIIYIIVDNGALVSTPLDRYHRITCESGGKHHVKVMMKSSLEKANRWPHPLQSAVMLIGIEADGFYDLPEDNRPKIEFIGDSITEGIAIDVIEGTYHGEEHLPVHYNDSAADYSYLTAKALNFRPYSMGYGRLGICTVGNGDIPPVINAYGYYSDGEPMESVNADYIVINHGANDNWADSELFTDEYVKFLAYVRERNEKSVIIALTPFGGYKADEIGEAVVHHNEKTGDNVYYVDSRGWVPKEPLHPLRDSHKEIARRLSEFIRKTFL